ncbi:UNVERIFIED_CONTAM: Transcriptional activator spt7 [Siphonaria sp. JEL0065]|nr:Transcriptional activator spt7 [Siphonaria sp. JEL0065]
MEVGLALAQRLSNNLDQFNVRLSARATALLKVAVESEDNWAKLCNGELQLEKEQLHENQGDPKDHSLEQPEHSYTKDAWEIRSLLIEFGLGLSAFDPFYSLEFDRVFINQYCPDDIVNKQDIPASTTNTNQSSSAPASNVQKKQQQQLPLKSNEAGKSDDPDNLKYLFEVIAKNARPEKEKDLKSLVQRVKRSRSKWAHDYRIGQEALYEALEKTLMELKNYTEHSEPFLVRVSKKDVPDYYDVIKNPMDLGTMTKKLHALEYLSKDDFAKDLALIWSNCLTFNIQPESIYRKKAFIMKRKSLDLLKKVPDIKIIIKPQDLESDSDDDEEKPSKFSKTANGSTSHQRSTKGMKIRRGSQGNDASNANAATAATNSAAGTAPGTPKPLDSSQHQQQQQQQPLDSSQQQQQQQQPLGDSNSKVASIDSPMIINFDDDDDVKPAPPPLAPVGGGVGDGSASVAGSVVDATSRAVTPEIGGVGTAAIAAGDSSVGDSSAVPTAPIIDEVMGEPAVAVATVVDDGPEGDEDYLLGASVQVKQFVEATEEIRKSNYMNRERSLTTPFPDRQIIHKDPAAFQVFLDSFKEFCELNLQRNMGKPVEERNKDKLFMPELTHFGTCLSNIPQREIVLEPPTASLSDYLEAHPDPNSKVSNLITKNIEFLRKIKEIHGRIAGTDDPKQAPTSRPPAPYKPKQDRSKLPEFVVNSGAAEAILTQCTSRLLVHAGFDAVQGSALSLLTDVGLQYMTNLGKTLRLYSDKCDKNNKSLSPEDILKRTLQVNGIENANKLDLYIRNDIQRYSAKLFDVKKRLSLMYKNLVESGGFDSSNGGAGGKLGGGFNINEMDAEIMSGNFLEDLGIDFLNLKELGIDVTSIPLELWNKKSTIKLKPKTALQLDSGTSGTDGLARLDPETIWKPITPAAVIGLLRPMYEARAAQNEELDDEDYESKSKAYFKNKMLMKQALIGRKKAIAVDSAKLAKQHDLAKSRDAAKKKREAEKAEKAKLKEEKKVKKKETKGAAAAAAASASLSTLGGAGTGVGIPPQLPSLNL